MARVAALLVAGGLAPLAAAAHERGACTAILTACQMQGFLPGQESNAKGIGLVVDCINPVMSGQQGGRLPVIAPQVVQLCQSEKALPDTARPPAEANGQPALGAPPEPPLPLPAGAPRGANIVVVLVDDFSMNLMTQDQNILARTMPNLARMIRDGVSFSDYFVTDSLCCPSRASIFTGRLPHNTGVLGNVPPDGGYDAFQAHGDGPLGFANALRAAHYRTAMMGKYLNGYQPEADGVPPGWSTWDVGGADYGNFDYLLNHDGRYLTSPAHLTDTLSRLARAYLRQAAPDPFFLEVATFSPHNPYVPPARYATAFADITYPRTPAYAVRPDATAPQWLQLTQPIDASLASDYAEDFRNRLRSDKGVDDMIGALRASLAKLGLDKTTYVIFTSDNGYHMGEYSLQAGKMTPFDTDIRVPLVVVGPGVPAGQTISATAQNIDLAPTFEAMAGLTPDVKMDGTSLLGLMTGQPVPAWRTTAVVEHRQSRSDLNNPDSASSLSGDPPDYVALRLKDGLYVEYATGEIGWYDLATDPWQLHNAAADLPAPRRASLHAALHAAEACSGQAACWSAQTLSP
jgi:arylsulfatase A-like enzyme